jgi:hypothetical protein
MEFIGGGGAMLKVEKGDEDEGGGEIDHPAVEVLFG